MNAPKILTMEEAARLMLIARVASPEGQPRAEWLAACRERNERLIADFDAGASKAALMARWMVGESVVKNTLFRNGRSFKSAHGTNAMQCNREIMAAWQANPVREALKPLALKYGLDRDYLCTIIRGQGGRIPLAQHQQSARAQAVSVFSQEQLMWKRQSDAFLRRLIPAAIRAKAIPPHSIRRVAEEARRLKLPVELVTITPDAGAAA